MTDAERMDELRVLFRGLTAKVKANRSRIPEDMLQRFGDSARAFLKAYKSPSVLDDNGVISQVYASDDVQSFYETYAGWAGLLAPYVGRSPLPQYQQTDLYHAARAAEDTVSAALDWGKIAIVAIGLYLLTQVKGK